MNMFKTLASSVMMLALFSSMYAGQKTDKVIQNNVDILNIKPNRTIYFNINNGRWLALNKNRMHYSFNVPIGKKAIINFSTNSDGSNPTRFLFSPILPADLYKLTTIKGTFTSYIQVSVLEPSGKILITPQGADSYGRTRYNFKLGFNNLTTSLIQALQQKAETLAKAKHPAAIIP